MSFNEKNATESALVALLSGPKNLGSSLCQPLPPYAAPSGKNQWQCIPGKNLVTYGRQPQDVFVDLWLKAALCQLNPHLAAKPQLADEVIHRLRGVLQESSYHGLVHANEIFMDWLLGRKSMPLGKDDEHITIKLIDFETPSNNHWVVSSQVHFIGAQAAYFDIVLFVNGLPLVVGEVKTPVRPSVSWQDGATDFLTGAKHYWENQRAFFVPNLLCFASEGKTFYYGAIQARFKNWAPWHSTTERDEIPQDLATVRRSAERLLAPATLLLMLQSFVVFSTMKVGEGQPSLKIKVLPRYPQFEAAKAIVKRVRTQDSRKGLIWHFQGSGKSLLMLFAAQMLKADQNLKNPTVIVVIDRVDLDSQINSVFNNASVKNVLAVKSCKELAQELTQDTRQILITTIFKFDEIEIDEKNPDGLNARNNIIVLVDEAHRTQVGNLGAKMRWALPHAFFFGLTGTPISGIERNTFRLFGSEKDEGHYLNRYSYKQSIRDQATLAVKFEPRLVELRIDREKIDQEFEQLAQQHELSDKEKASLSAKAGKLANLLKAPKRMTAIADDIAQHYNTHVAPKQFKGMVVVYDREAVVQMYYLLGERLGKAAVEAVMNISRGSLEKETDEKGEAQNISPDWLKWKELGLALEKDDFRRWQSIDNGAEVQEKLLDRYRDPSDPLKLIVVTEKLLTGFDAPICYCMYLDKPLRDHTLLQAMCRTNRPYSETKRYGLIIDYLGVFENIARALDYDPKDIEGVVESIAAFKQIFPTALQKCLDFFPGVDRSITGDEGLLEAQNCLIGDEKKDAYAAQFNVLKRFWEALTPDPFLNAYQRDYLWLAQVYASIKPMGGVGSLLWQSLGPETLRIIHENTEVDRIRDDLEELVMDEQSVLELSPKEREKKAQKLNLSLMAQIKAKNDPRFEELGQRLQQLKDLYEKGVISSLEWLKKLLDAARQKVKLDQETDEKVVRDKKQALTEIFREVKTAATPQIIADIVKDIDKIVEDIDTIVTEKRFDGWQEMISGEREIKKALRETLLKYKLHNEKELFEKAFHYIRQHY